MGYPSYDLTLAQYAREVARTATHPDRTQEEQRPVFALGLGGESGEVCDLVKKHIGHGREIDRDELKKELGDVLWYVAALGASYGIDLEDIARANMEKLQKRYPNGFVHGGGVR